MTIQELESSCDASQPLDFSRHELEAPELSLRGTFYPLGFPMELRTNSSEVLLQASELWSVFEKRFDTEPICVDVHVVKGDSMECPPAPVCRIMMPLIFGIADGGNFILADLEKRRTRIAVSRATVNHGSFFKYFFLGSAPLSHIATRYTTPLHAACVSLDGRGVLLCGDSGAGKSSLSYACARANWTYVTDDSSYLLNHGKDRLVTGNCHQIRFRPTATELFPEVTGLEITPRATGKPSIELPTASIPQMICAQTARVDFMIFLNRRSGGPSELVPYRKDVARHFFRQVLYGPAESLAVQYEAIEWLLTANILELRFTSLDWATNRLEKLIREGR
jgi:hypothetical protein